MTEGAGAEPKYDLDVSVIIPALALTADFAKWVGALARQEPAFSFEIIVVLNHAPRPVEFSFPERVRLLFSERPGSFPTRNAGIAAARGGIFAFTDSDVIPHAKWLEEGYAAVETLGGNMLVAGRIQMFHNRKTATAIYDGGFYLQQNIYVEHHGFGATANLWVPAKIVADIGGFQGDLHSAGDAELCWRARRAGYGIAYAENAVVFHPTRDSLRKLLIKERRLAGGMYGLAASVPEFRLHSEWDTFRARMKVIRDTYPLPRSLPIHAVNILVASVRAVERIMVRLGKRPVRY